MKAVHFNSWRDLQPYGINMLTGESCAYSQRLLCDLSEKGVDLFREFFGLMIVLDPQTQFPRSWNSRVGDDPAVASVMLPHALYGELVKFIIFHIEKCELACQDASGSWHGYNLAELPADISIGRLQQLFPKGVYRNPKASAPCSGSRNIHAFTGRSE